MTKEGLVLNKTPERPNIYESAEQALNGHMRELEAWVDQGFTKEEAAQKVFDKILNSERAGDNEKKIIEEAIQLYLNS